MFIFHPFIQEYASQIGLSLGRVLPFSQAFEELTSDKIAFEKWIQKGFHGDMSYLERHHKTRFQGQGLLEGAQSWCFFAVPYATGVRKRSLRPIPEANGPFAIARYAQVKDYHKILKRVLGSFGSWLVSQNLIQRFQVCVDTVPILEKALGRLSGLGFIGKNTLLIRPGLGSFFFIASLIVDAPPYVLGEEKPIERLIEKASCGNCRRCLEACPTEALVEPYILDASRCIAYLTIEKRASFTDWDKRHLHQQFFGCDICQEVCPYNYMTGDWVELSDFQTYWTPPNSYRSVIRMSMHDYVQWFGGTALTRAKRIGLIRNALLNLWEHDAASAQEEAQWLLDQGPLEPALRSICEWILDQNSHRK